VRDFITQSRFTGVNGTYDFKAPPQRGLDANAVVMVRWESAKDTWVAVSRLGGSPYVARCGVVEQATIARAAAHPREMAFAWARSELMTRRIFSQRAADERFEHVARVCADLAAGNVRLAYGYSVKTNPHERMISTARRHSFLGEVISDDEAAWAEQAGYLAADLIYNGPRPPAPRHGRIGTCFADSLEAFARNVALTTAELAGVRLRPSMLTASRFGIPVDQDDELIAALRGYRAPLGVSMHARRADYAGASWRDLCDDLLRRAVRIERETSCRVIAFDVGGGWEPQQFDAEFPADGRWLVERLQDVLPGLRTLLIEPGQALATPVESILTTVLEVRRRRGRIEAVVELGYGDWPSQHAYVHEFALARGDYWVPIGRGGDRLAGSTCLEYDYVDGLRFPTDIAAGDRLLVRNTGSYDRSMGFSFGRGRLTADVLEEVEA
jgi:diaminopimelate decarboxylase